MRTHELNAPRPWAKWQRGPVPRHIDDSRVAPHLARFGKQGLLVGVEETWQNGWYAVMVRPIQTEWGPVIHLMIRNAPNTPVRSWTDLQRIKDELVGPERVAIEVFPPRADIVDQANMTHLWVLPADMEIPFGLLPGQVAAAQRATNETRTSVPQVSGTRKAPEGALTTADND